VIEQLVDMAAAELGIDAVELRRRNLIRDFPFETALGWTYDSGDYERCLDLAVELLRPEQSTDEDRLVGSGVALSVERCGGLWESAEVELARDGGIVVRSGSSPHGQGHATTFSQIVADELAVDPADVSFEFGDSAVVPAGIGSFASRSVAMGGSALVVALGEVKEQARAIAAELLETELEAVEWDGSRYVAEGRSVSLADAAAAASAPLKASSRFSSPLLFSSGAYGAVVEIERATGFLRVLRLAAVDDAGRIVNPLLAEAQVVGGALQAVGQCLTEAVVHDAEGLPSASSFADYTLPTAVDAPAIVNAFVESPSPHNPLGAKGIGEAGAVGVPPAIANAVASALGRRLDPPFTPEKLWRALQEQ
jgi:carbon-monoxide dehydrogenase large subunit